MAELPPALEEWKGWRPGDVVWFTEPVMKTVPLESSVSLKCFVLSNTAILDMMPLQIRVMVLRV